MKNKIEIGEVEQIILKEVFRQPGCNITHIYKQSGRTYGSITNNVNDLVARGLLLKNIHDNKRHSLVLTQKGYALANVLVQLEVKKFEEVRGIEETTKEASDGGAPDVVN